MSDTEASPSQAPSATTASPSPRPGSACPPWPGSSGSWSCTPVRAASRPASSAGCWPWGVGFAFRDKVPTGFAIQRWMALAAVVVGAGLFLGGGAVGYWG